MSNKAPTFDDFWQVYPLHKGKIEAERAWNRLSAGDKHKALAGIPRYREECQRTGVAIKYPQGWLNGHRWEDEYEETGTVSVGSANATKTELSPCGEPQGTVAAPTPPLSDMDTW